jgi:GntR family transcriptional regulator
MTQTIDRTSPVPYYEQLYAILKRRILDGEFPEGERLPSELELGRDFNLSRATVRQTLSTLESDGFAHRVPRRGFFAAQPKPASGWFVQESEGFLESQIRHGRTGISTTVVSAGAGPAEPHVREALGLAAGEEAFALERVRSLNSEMALFSTNWFPLSVGEHVSRARDVLNGTGSLNSALRTAGFLVHDAKRIIHALPAPAGIAEHLGVEAGHPLLRIRSQSWTAEGLCFDYYETWVLTDTVPLEMNAAAAGTAAGSVG